MNYTKAELLRVSHVPKSEINNIDEGMIPILIELNSKNYYTSYCCEGHIKEDGWHSYIAFEKPYKISPPNKERVANGIYGKAYYWSGNTEKERIEWLCSTLEWAKSLPKREERPKYYYEVSGGKKVKTRGYYNKEEVTTSGRKNYVVTRKVIGYE